MTNWQQHIRKNIDFYTEIASFHNTLPHENVKTLTAMENVPPCKCDSKIIGGAVFRTDGAGHVAQKALFYTCPACEEIILYVVGNADEFLNKLKIISVYPEHNQNQLSAGKQACQGECCS